MWGRNVRLLTIYEKYVPDHFAYNVTVVFVGYPDSADDYGTTKSECLPWFNKVACTPLLISTIPQEKFVANDRNKNRLIIMMKTELFKNCYS